ncbi:hypothetical protein [Dactylosporangium sp. CA-092794]|uniref:hypothetical protein n=1 Tax=Dactylosporangium sp. CA-092794 TaxID=3239929 RepID=UPI003D8AD2FD
MLAPTAVAGIAEALGGYAGTERDPLPSPQFEIIYEYAPKNGPKALEFNLIHESVWRGWDADAQLGEDVGLAEFLAVLTANIPRWLPQHRQDSRFTIIGFTLRYDEPLSSSVDADHGGIDEPALRAVLAMDVDHRRYQMLLGTDRPATPVQVSETGGPLPDDATAPHRQQAWSAPTSSRTPPPPPIRSPTPTAMATRTLAGDVLVAGEIVTVTGDRFDDDQRNQLWVVVDYFDDYTIAVLGGDGYQWPRVPRGDLTPITAQWIRRVIRRDGTNAYVSADSTEPVLLDDAFHRLQPGCYELTRVYRLAGQVLRVQVHRGPEPEHSTAQAQVLEPTGGFTTVAVMPPADWHPGTPSATDSAQPLYPIAERLLHRATRILAPPTSTPDC